MARQTGKPVSECANCMPPFLVMEVMERAKVLERMGRSVVHLEVGEPDFDTPRVIVEAAVRALADGRTHYTHSMGYPELREVIADWQHRQYGVEVSPERILVTLGCSGAMMLVFAALLDPGSEVLLTNPHYACYPQFVTTARGIPVRMKVCEQDGFQYDPQLVQSKLNTNTRALVLNSPANPTGILSSPAIMEELARVTEGRAVIVSDEIYHGLVYGDRAHSILEFCSHAVVINGFSKLFAMTGWRLGYAILPDYLVRPVQKLQQNLLISAPDFAQMAAIAALTEAEADVEHMRSSYDQRRRYLLKRLKELGLEVLVEPTGAFYVFVNVKQATNDVYDFVFRLLEEKGVAVAPGVDFGPGGEGYVRISYANSLSNIGLGLDRMQAFLETARQG